MEHVGKFKSEVLEEYLHSLNKNWNITTKTEYFMYGDQQVPDTIIENVDILIATLDNYRVSFWINLVHPQTHGQG